MRVCYVSKTCIGHFTQSDAIYHVPLSLARRWKLSLLTGESPRPRQIAELIESELIVSPGPAWTRRAYEVLSKHHARAPIQVVLTGIDESSLLVGFKAQRHLGIPWIAICEDHPFQSRYDRAGFRGHIEKIARTWFLRFILRYPQKLLYFIHPDVLNFLWIRPSIKSPLHNAADLETIEPIRDQLDAHFRSHPRPQNLIGYVGMVNEAKGGTFMLEVFRHVVESIPDARMRLVGRIDETFRPLLDGFLGKHDLGQKIEITGQVSSDEALRLAGECTLCIHAYSPLPWLYWNHVLKVLEYMALGVPVVSVDYPGTKSQIQNERNGILVPAGNPDLMAAEVIKLLQDPIRLTALRNGGIARAQELSWKALETKLYEIVQLCATQNGRNILEQ